MPTYSYRCADCGHAFDIHQAFTDDALTICPSCGGALRKVFSPVGVTFSGSGFYRTDSRATTGGGSGSSDSSSGTASSSAATSTSSSGGTSSGGTSSGGTSSSGGAAGKE
jgi:putative FmdB family regulatory protein